MIKHKRSQVGFGVVEILCFAVMFSMVGLIGWYVINENQNSQETLDNIGGAEVQTSSDKPAGATEKFVFKDLGIEVPLPEKLKGLTYEILPGGEAKTTALLYTAEFSALAKVCLSKDSVTKHPFAMLQRINKGSSVDSGNLLKKFDGFEIRLFEVTGSKCEASAGQAKADEFKKLYLDLNRAVITAVKSATLAN